MKLNFHRRMALFTVCILIFGLAGLIPFGNERVYAGTGGEIYTVAGGNYGDLGDGGLAVDAELSNLSAVAVDGNGNLYIADTGNNKIRKVDAVTKQISTVAGSGGYDYSGDGGSALSAQLRSPSGVAVDDTGHVYIADKYNNRIRKVDTSGKISTIAGTGGNDYSGDNGPAVEAELSNPGGVAVDGNGNLYIADTGNSRIRKIAADGTITTVAGVSDYGTYSGDGGPAVDADLNGPSALAIDSAGNLYIADTENSRIRKVDTNGIISTVAGSSGDGYSGDGTPAVNAQLNEPEGVAVDGSGNLYIADTDNNRIRKVSANGKIITIAGTGNGGYSGDDGSGMLAELNGPAGLAMDSSGTLYIADKYNYAVRKQVSYIPSSDASLSDVTLSSGALSPAFASGTFDYTASVVNGVSSIRVTPTTADHLITVEVNGESVASGAQSGDIDLNVGDNTITLVALAEDGETTKTYTITIERLRSSNANLSQLSLSNGTLSPAFASNTTSYSANVNQSAITVTPTMADPMAAMKVNGTTVTNGAASQSIPLNIGNTAITVVVTAQDGTTTKTYTINITRTISANADLSGLALSNGTLSPSFGSGTTVYTASVGNNVNSITVSPTTADGNAVVTVNGVAVDSGAASASLPLVVGSNTIAVAVTAENGTTTKTYTITVTRAKNSNADLNDLTLSNGALIPSFIPGTFKTSVDHQVSSVTVTPTVSDAVYAAATVSLYASNGMLVSGPFAVTSGTASPSLPLTVGSNTITVLVTAQDGTTKTYSVTVTRGASSNADLSNLTLSSGALIPAFAGTYTANVGYSTDSVTVTPTLSDAVSASVTASVYDDSGTLAGGPFTVLSGTASPSLPLSVGNNAITISVTAQDGTVRTYRVTVTRAASSLANLSGLVLSDGTLSPAFEAGTTQYTASVGAGVSDITVTMTVADADKATTTTSIYNSAETLISGPFDMSSGTAAVSLPLQAGSNEISIVVTTREGTAKTYTVGITRATAGTAPSGGGGGGGGGGGSAPFVNEPVIDLNGQTLDPAGIDTKKPFITLEATPTDGVAYVNVPMYILTDLAIKNGNFYLAFKTPYGSYQVPANLASLMPTLPDVLAKNKLQAKDVSVKITLTDKSDDKELQAALAKGLPNGKVMGAMVDYHIDILNTQTAQVIGVADQFSKAITRVISMPRNVAAMPEQWGAFRYADKAKQWEFVPAKAVRIDGVWYVALSSYSNSTYVVAENVTRFADMEKHWAQPVVELAATKGLVEGSGGGRYDPDQAVTRAEFTTMLARALGRGAPTGSDVPYSDVPAGAWYFNPVQKMKELGLTAFAQGDEFRPNEPLTREEMASMLAAAVRLEQLLMPGKQISLGGYTDAGTIDAAYLEDVRTMVQLNIMTGTGTDTFSPKGTTTRAQAAAVLVRTLQALGWLDVR